MTDAQPKYEVHCVSVNQQRGSPSATKGENSVTVAALAKSKGVNVADIWLPCAASASPKAKVVFTVECHIPLAVLHHENNRVSFSRDKVLGALGLHAADPRNVIIPETALHQASSAVTIFTKSAENAGRKIIRDGTTVLICKMTHDEAIACGSAYTNENTISSAAVTEPSADGDNVAAHGDFMSKRHSLLEDLMKKVAASSGKRPREGDDEGCDDAAVERSRELLRKTNEDLVAWSQQPPLHQVRILSGNCKEFIKFRVGGSFLLNAAVPNASAVWRYPDMYALLYYHLPVGNRISSGREHGSNIQRIFAPQRLLAFVPLLGTLVDASSPNFEAKLFSSEALQKDTIFQLTSGDVAESIRRTSRRGYKIVVFEHFPQLHHGNAHILGCVTKNIVQFFNVHFPNIAIEVLLSVASRYCDTPPSATSAKVSAPSAGNKSRPSPARQFLLPRTGIAQVAIFHLNGQVSPDASRSFIVSAPSSSESDRNSFGFHSLTPSEQQEFSSSILPQTRNFRLVPFEAFVNDIDTIIQ